MYTRELSLIQNSTQAYLLFHSKTMKILDGNTFAKSLFEKDGLFPNVDELFQVDAKTYSTQKLIRDLKENHIAFAWNVVAIKHTGASFLCDLQIQPFDEENHVYVIILTTKIEENALCMKEWVDTSSKPIFMLTFDGELNVGYANPAFYRFFDMNQNIFHKRFQSSLAPLLSEDYREEFIKQVYALEDAHSEFDMDVIFSLDQKVFDLQRIIAKRIYMAGNTPIVYAEIIHISKQIALMEERRYDQQYFDAMQEFSKDLLHRIDIKRKVLSYKGNISRFFGLAPVMEQYPECIHRLGVIHPDDIDNYTAYVDNLMNGVAGYCEVRVLMQNRSYERYRLQSKIFYNNDGEAIEAIGRMENIQKYFEIESRATLDSLTRVLNRESFRELVEDILSRAVVSNRFALLLLNMDDFKDVNQSISHDFGDFLLETACKRLKHCVRSDDMVGRLEGDSFTVFFRHAPTHETIMERAKAILESFQREFSNGIHTYSTHVSIGIALYPEHSLTYESLYNHAYIALQNSKTTGKNKATIFDKTMGTS